MRARARHWHDRLVHRDPPSERLSMSKHEVFSWRQCRWYAGSGRGPGRFECLRVGRRLGRMPNHGLVCREVKWTGLGNPPGELAILLDPYMARPRLNHNNNTRVPSKVRGARLPDRCQSLLRCLPTVPIFPCRRDSVPCLCPVSALSPPCLPGARRVRPGKGSALRFCFVSSMQPHLAVGLSVCQPSVRA